MANGFVRAAGGLPVRAKALLVPENLREGVHIQGGGLDVTGSFTADATASAGQILSGQSAYVRGNKVTGTISSKAAATITPGTSDQVLEAGQYLEGAQTIQGDANLVPGNIRGGVSVFGVSGALSGAGVVGVFGLCGGEWYADWSYDTKWSTYGPTFTGSCLAQIPIEITADGTRSRTYTTKVTSAFTGVVQISCTRSFNVSVTTAGLSFSSTSAGNKVSSEHVFNVGDTIQISWNNGQRPYGIMLLVMFVRTK